MAFHLAQSKIFLKKKFKLNLDKRSFSLFILVAVLAAELFFILPFSLRRIIVVNRNVARIRQQIAAVKNDWPHKNGYAERNKKLKDEINRIRFRIISPQEANELLSFLSSAAKSFGVQIEFLRPAEAVAYSSQRLKKLEYIPITVKAKSTFHKVAQLLNYLHQSKYFFIVKDFKMVSGEPLHSIEMVICGVIQEKK